MLEKEPGYRFVLDGQTAIIEDWCEQLSKQGQDPAIYLEKLSGYVREERVQIGPYYLQPDWQLVSEEALVHNLLIGQQMSEQWGGRMPVGWLLDNFGQISQAPQLHRAFGIDGLFVWRGVEMDPAHIRSEFTWEAPDGSKVTAIYLVGSYRNGMRLAEYPQVMAARIKDEIRKLSPFASTPNILLMNGYDQEMIPDDILPYLNGAMKTMDGTRVIQSTPPEYLEAVNRDLDPRAPLEIIRGGLYSGRFISIFPGILSSRMYLKLRNDACQKRLEKLAEPLAALMWTLGQVYPAAELNRSWKLLLKNHPHDSICGVSIDDVHTDMEDRFTQSEQLSSQVVRKAFAKLVDHINTTGQPRALKRWVVANPALKTVDELVDLPAPLPENVVFNDEMDRRIPFQRNAAGGCVLSLSGLPAYGYQTLFAAEGSENSQGPAGFEPPAAQLRVDPAQNTIENGLIKVTIAGDGSLTVIDKANQVSYAGLAVFEDGGDAGDTYTYSYPLRDKVITSQAQNAEICFLESGPLRARVKIKARLQIPQKLAPDRAERGLATCDLTLETVVTIEAGSALVKFHTHLANPARDHRLRVLFPSGLQTRNSQAETQFDVVTRLIEPERYDDATIPAHVKQVIIGAREPEPVTIFPERSFVDLTDCKVGLAVINQGLPEYEILAQVSTIALTLFRCVGWIARPDLLTRIGDAGPLIAAPGAQCLRKMDFDYAVLVHSGDWQTGQVMRAADGFNSSLLVAETQAHPGPLPPSSGFLRLADSSGQLKVTAIKCSEDGQALVVRLHNPTQTSLPARIESIYKVKRAWFADPAEDRQQEILGDGHYSIPFTIEPKKIVTLRLEIERLKIIVSPYEAPVQLVKVSQLEPEDEHIQTVEVISLDDISREADRAAQLEQALSQKEQELARFMTGGLPASDLDWAKNFQLRLDAATFRRTALEARLSETLLLKNYWKEHAAGSGAAVQPLEIYEDAIRRIGDAIHTARIEKRALEYVVSAYSKPVSQDFDP